MDFGKILFWDVDTQYDFMMPDGKLYVKGAETISENLSRLTRYARTNGIRICGSVDYHLVSDPEISDSPDYHETFPPHCLQDTPGQKKVSATAPVDPLWIDNRQYDRRTLRETVGGHSGEIIFRKQKFDVFSNPNVHEVLDILRPREIVVYGVALDVCDAYAIEGFLAARKYDISLVTDAAKPIYEEKGKSLVADWSRRGVRMLTTREVEEGKILQVQEKAV